MLSLMQEMKLFTNIINIPCIQYQILLLKNFKKKFIIRKEQRGYNFYYKSNIKTHRSRHRDRFIA